MSMKTEKPKVVGRLWDIVIEALLRRGFSEGESTQILERLLQFGKDAEFDPEPDQSDIIPIMPIGKYRGMFLNEIPLNSLLWYTEQDWFNEKYDDIAKAIRKYIVSENKRRTAERDEKWRKAGNQ